MVVGNANSSESGVYMLQLYLERLEAAAKSEVVAEGM